MKVTAVSDSHNLHGGIDLSGGDLFIHSGDSTYSGTESEVKSFMDWLKNDVLPKYRYVVFIAGNHETAHQFKAKQAREWLRPYLSDRLIYLQDSAVVIDGFKIYGSPWTPQFGYGYGFNEVRGRISKHWEKIPADVDILVTHGPPTGYGDKVVDVVEVNHPIEYWKVIKEDWIQSVGCDELFNAICKIKPQLHVFGHVHQGYGVYDGRDELEGCILVNAAACGERGRLANKPIDIILDAPR